MEELNRIILLNTLQELSDSVYYVLNTYFKTVVNDLQVRAFLSSDNTLELLEEGDPLLRLLR